MTVNYQDRIDAVEKKITNLEKNIIWYKQFAASIGIVGFCLFFVLQFFIINGSPEERNIINILGSISGGVVSSLFALAGLILVYVAFLGQRQQVFYQQIEMIYNKIELDLTRKEMQNQQLEMKKQNDTLTVQKFENLFFQLISNYQNIKTSFYIVMDKNLFMEFKDSYYRLLNEIDYENKSDLLISQFTYNDVILENSTFENTFLYQVNSILKFVYSSDDIADKELYIDILGKAMSTAEKFCLFLVCQLDGSISENDKEFIERSQILNGISLPQVVR